MPIFEYRCRLCDNRFELFIRSSSNKKPICPRCKNEGVERIFSVFGFSKGKRFISSSVKTSCGSCITKRCDSCGI